MMQTPTALQVRAASPGDARALLDLEERCFQTDRIPARQMRYLLSKAKAMTFVACYDAQIIGYAMVFVPQHPRPARLYSIAVDEAFRGRSVAAQLLEAVLAYTDARHYNRVRLEVRLSHLPVQSLYQRFGFEAIGQKAAYYGDGEDALIMECPRKGLA